LHRIAAAVEGEPETRRLAVLAAPQPVPSSAAAVEPVLALSLEEPLGRSGQPDAVDE